MSKCGYVAFIGAPNAGKSTLLNQLVGQKLAIVTPKAQTTRNRITGVILEGDTQMVLLDVPGVFDAPKQKPLEQAMVQSAWDGAADADIIAMMVDVNKGLNEQNRAIVERLQGLAQGKRVVLVFNKIDTINKEKLLALTTEFHEQLAFDDTLYLSALKGQGVPEFKAYLAEHMPEGPWLYPEDQLTDMPSRLLASEITREKLFMSLREELPYSLTVETESWEVRDDGSIKIDQVIFVEREGQKGIVLGKGGGQLKAIGKQSREELSRMFECPIHLFLFVKVRENWKSNPDVYQYLGLKRH